ncbi:type II toxin-antitoxin system RelE/ParE family toxin [Candidatus Pacearchaeota archaeon]|nr:type II toxin-antitoxin system RelE/ParE family toxin [Candidatus Pacearchaeota archaeon]
MTYLLKWSKIALEDLDKLPQNIIDRILKKLDQVIENPKHFIEGLSEMPVDKIRVGDYRILVDLIEKEKILLIRTLGHRKNIYKKYKTE